jgi:DNA-directed RNA polymerase subunit RPC12/RpoP
MTDHSEHQETIQQSEHKKACVNCGASLVYNPGTDHIKCNYCGHEEVITEPISEFQELELHPYLEQMGSQSYTEKISLLNCKSCGANQHVEENYKSLHCVYCSEPLITEESFKEDWILPGAILPFQFAKEQAVDIFQKWIKSLWFAPNVLKKTSLQAHRLKGLYLPFWTFDAQLYGSYTGQRGDYYYETERYTTYENGERVTKTRQVRKTRWSYASGNISGFIDDTLINASNQHKGKIPSRVYNWNLQKLETFDSKYLAGFVTEKYTLSLKNGHLESKDEARRIADRWARNDIGGDTQRVHSLNFNLSEETFKHILLPIYISSYTYKNKQYYFYINGQSGSISGKRPYSFWKIFFAVLLGLIVIAAIVLIVKKNQ